MTIFCIHYISHNSKKGIIKFTNIEATYCIPWNFISQKNQVRGQRCNCILLSLCYQLFSVAFFFKFTQHSNQLGYIKTTFGSAQLVPLIKTNTPAWPHASHVSHTFQNIQIEIFFSPCLSPYLDRWVTHTSWILINEHRWPIYYHENESSTHLGDKFFHWNLPGFGFPLMYELHLIMEGLEDDGVSIYLHWRLGVKVKWTKVTTGLHTKLRGDNCMLLAHRP